MIYNLQTMLLTEIVLGILLMVNVILGAYLSKAEFQWKTLLKGVLKGLIIAVTLLAFTFGLELIPMLLTRISIEIPEGIITTIQIFSILIVAISKYGTDALEKLKNIIGMEK